MAPVIMINSQVDCCTHCCQPDRWNVLCLFCWLPHVYIPHYYRAHSIIHFTFQGLISWLDYWLSPYWKLTLAKKAGLGTVIEMSSLLMHVMSVFSVEMLLIWLMVRRVEAEIGRCLTALCLLYKYFPCDWHRQTIYLQTKFFIYL